MKGGWCGTLGMDIGGRRDVGWMWNWVVNCRGESMRKVGEDDVVEVEKVVW